MKAPTGDWFELEECGSTQDVAATLLEKPHCPDVVFAHHQLDGRGRLRRTWHSRRDDSLTFSLLFHGYKGHAKPWLLGMATAIAVAQVLDARLQWPNDVVMDGKKVGGILIELLPIDAALRTPVVGVGVNLNQREFTPEIDHKATSVFLQKGVRTDPIELGKRIVTAVGALPEPLDWPSLAPYWSPRDDTPGKQFVLSSGESATAIRVGSSGELVCDVDGKEQAVFAADALFG